MILFGAKLRTDRSPNVPTFLLFFEEPKDSAASSIKGIFFLRAISCSASILHGSPELRLEDKERSLREFRGEPGETEVNVLIANPASLAESVSLHQVCHHAIYVDRTFNATHWIQSKKRIHRVGMDDVETRYTILKSTFADSNDQTVDERVRRRLDVKEERMRQFLNDPRLNNNEMELNWNEDGAELGADAEDYAGVLESIRQRMTNVPNS